jgi:hypothetical protein
VCPLTLESYPARWIDGGQSEPSSSTRQLAQGATSSDDEKTPTQKLESYSKFKLDEILKKKKKIRNAIIAPRR